MDLKDMVFSYSRLNSFNNCKYGWHKTYIEKERGVSNFFSESGLLYHSIMEDYCEGKLHGDYLKEEYLMRYPNFITHKAPYNKYCDLEEKRKQQGLDALKSFKGFDDIGKVVAVEQEIDIMIADTYKFTGFIDLVLQDEDGEYIILDHKSATNIKDADEYFRQLYVYATHIKNTTGKYPVKLMLNQFNIGKILSTDFDIDEYNKAMKWCEDTIKAIESELFYEPKVDYYFCHNLCNHRNTCKHKQINK